MVELRRFFNVVMGIVVFSIFILMSQIALAEITLGISPPLIIKKVMQGSTFEEIVFVSRADDRIAYSVKTYVDGDMEKWISLTPDDDFTIPEGKISIPVKIKVKVPDSALGNYFSKVNVGASETGDLVNAVGAGIELPVKINLTVIGEEMLGYSVENLSIIDSSSELKVYMELENIGNVESSPDSLEVKIFEIMENKPSDSILSEKVLLLRKDFSPIIKILAGTKKQFYFNVSHELEPNIYSAIVNVYDQDVKVFTMEKQIEIKISNSEKLNSLSWPALLVIAFVVLVVGFHLNRNSKKNLRGKIGGNKIKKAKKDNNNDKTLDIMAKEKFTKVKLVKLIAKRKKSK